MDPGAVTDRRPSGAPPEPSAPPEPRTRIWLCAPLRLEIDGRDVAPVLPGGQASVLLSYLLTRPHLAAAREELIAALWPERPPGDPQANLRPLLSRLRRGLDPGRLEGRERLRLALPEPVWIDVDEASRAVERARVAAARGEWVDTRERAAAAYEVLRRDLLPGRHHDWLEVRRRELEELALEALEWLARSALALRGAELAAAERLGRDLVARAPYRETGHRLVMEALAASGNVAEALRVYDDLRVLLREELGASPTAELQSLHHRLLTAGDAEDPPPAPLPRPAPADGTGATPDEELLERAAERRILGTAVDESVAAGRVVVVLGEAGIGKTAIVTSVAGELDGRRVLWGSCDPLITPRPLGPWWDVAHDAGGPLLAALQGPGGREGVLRAALDELAAGAVLVIDDLHWADDATLDLVALLGRRLRRTRGCLVVTCRSDALAEQPEVRRALAGLPREAVRRVEPGPLSEAAVDLLARRAGRRAGDLHAATRGNPFLVTEALAAPGDEVPASVRDAVALRLADLDHAARAVAELAAVNPGPLELDLIAATVGGGATAVDACIAAGLLHLHGPALAFRHDLARRAVADLVAPARRRELNGQALAALEAAEHADPARLAHHARQSGDVAAVLRLVPRAARAAAAAGAHRQAVDHWEAVLAHAGGAEALRAEALEGVAIEAYLCGRAERALEARKALLALHEAAGDGLRTGDDLRWISRLEWWMGGGAQAVATGDRAIAVLEAFPDSVELAQALSGRSQLAMMAERNEEAIALGTRAVALARRVGHRETVAHGLTNIGTAFLAGRDQERGRELLEEAHALAREAGEDEHAARALVNLATAELLRRRDDPRVPGDLERAVAFARERELDGYLHYALGQRATLRLLQGDWPAAEADARVAMEFGEHLGVGLIPALVALGRLQARRGDPEASATLARAWDMAEATGEPQRLAPAAAARAEHVWLQGDLAGTAAAARPTHELMRALTSDWPRAELAFWLWRAGSPVPAWPGDPPAYARSIAGDWRGAAAAWEAMGFPYERADALSEAEEEAPRLEALAIFDRLGATRAAERLRERLEAAGPPAPR